MAQLIVQYQIWDGPDGQPSVECWRETRSYLVAKKALNSGIRVVKRTYQLVSACEWDGEY